MKVPAITGLIERRILINFRADPKVIAAILPAPFKPKLHRGKAVVGICLIRLKNIRPKGFPDFIGISSENGAHRIAVEWDEAGAVKEGVYIPRRDTSLRLNALVGGRLFPGKHYLTKFNVIEKDHHYHVDFISNDNTAIAIDACETETFSQHSIFENLQEVSDFFEGGSVGYSPNGKKFDGLKLETHQWKVKPLEVQLLKSSFFEDENNFPKGSIQFDNALLMTNIKHEWKTVADK